MVSASKGETMLEALALSAVLASGPLADATEPERAFLQCVAHRESRNNPKARNKRSSAAGTYQFLTPTWQGNAKWAKWKNTYPARPYQQAHQAPAWVQHLVALHSIRRGGWTHWYYSGSRCNALGRALP
jgi:hypothetical protein